MKFGAVIAAAGLSSRMHEFKPMMRLGNSTIVDNVIDNLKCAGTEKITVVMGYKAEFFKKHLSSRGVMFCENKDYARSKMLDSVKIGLQQMITDEDCDYYFITPVDIPLVSPETMEKMKHTAERKIGIIRPSLDGMAGHPVLISSQLAKSLIEYDGGDGLRGFLNTHQKDTCYVVVEDKGILTDADTREDYKVLRRLEMEKKSRGRLWYDIDIQVAKSNTILTAETAQFLEMIDHTGSIQSACVCMHMSYSKGWNILRQMEHDLGYPLTIRTSGGEGGGGTTMSEKGRKLLAAYRKFTSTLNKTAADLFEEVFTDELHE